MMKNAPSLEEWRELYKAAIQVKEITPWKWMEETDIFGVQHPETDELGFVSVMGMLGEYYAIAVYRGSKGLNGFWRFQEAGHLASPEDLLEVPQLQVSFANRDELQKEDYDTIKKLKLKFRGKSDWPLFRSHRPGFFPWFVEAEEALFLRYILEQTVEVALRFKDNPLLLEPPNEESYFVRVPHRENERLTWEDRILQAPPPEPQTIPITMDLQMLDALKSIPQSKHKIESDFFMFPLPTREKDDRPFFPYVLLMVDAQSGMILGTEMLQPQPSLEAMWGLIPGNIVAQLARVGIRPQEIKVRSDLLLQLLQPVAKEVGFKLTQSRKLKNLDAAKESLFQHFMPR
jgi:hypothetical protein